MPNEQNICSPVALISTARSGTSLVHRIFESHPEFEVVGETAPIVFGPWYAVERTQGIVRATKENGRILSMEERATRVVHNTFLTLFYDEKPRWMHKPIAAPVVLRLVSQQHGTDAAFEWYWRVMNHVFPEGSFITILRNPFDVVLSQMAFFDRQEQGVWRGIAKMARILTHPHSSASHAIVYADLLTEPEEILAELFADIGVPFHREVTGALDRIHAPAPGRERIDPTATSRSADWSRLNPDCVTPDIERAITRLWRKFDARFDVPEHFAARGIRFGNDALTPALLEPAPVGGARH